MPDAGGLPAEASAAWEAVVESAEDHATEYRDRNWTVTVVHPGDSVVVTGEHVGLSVLAPGSEYDTIRELASAHSFDRTHVYRREAEGHIFVLSLFESTADEVAVIVPAFLPAQPEELHMLADDRGELPLHVRPLDEDERTIFTIPDPALVFESDQ